MEQINMNKVWITGRMVENLKLHHKYENVKFYESQIVAKRKSGVEDFIIVIFSEEILKDDEIIEGAHLRIKGEFRSRNYPGEDGKRHLYLYCLVREYEILSENSENADINNIEFEGYICKKPIYRITFFGREITDIMIAVNRSFGRSSYIPCILWGRNARKTANLEIGQKLKLQGRIQSKKYKKKYPGKSTIKEAYEVSISKMTLLMED